MITWKQSLSNFAHFPNQWHLENKSMQLDNYEKLFHSYTRNISFYEIFHLLAHVMQMMDSQTIPILPHFAINSNSEIRNEIKTTSTWNKNLY